MRVNSCLLAPMLLASAAMVSPVRGAPAAMTGIATDNGAIVLSDHAGTVLDITPIIWGPRWGWTGISGKLANEQGATTGQFKGALGGTGVPFALDLRVERVAPRQLRVTAGFAAERDSDLTLACLAVTPGARFHGAATCALTTAGKGQETRPVPFGRGQIGADVARLALKGAAADAVTLDFATPANILADGAARIVLAAEHIAAGKRQEVTMTITLPAEVTWYATAADVPYPADWNEWFAWQPTDALTATNNATPDSGVGMEAWNREPAGARGRVVSRGNQLLAGGAPAKFWGLNDCFAPGCTPARDMAERRAVLYARMGINAVRLHKYADGAGWAGILSRERFTEFDPAALDRMDYFVAQLKARGIYIKLSPNFGSVRLGPADAANIPWLQEFAAGRGGDGYIATGNGSIYLARELQDLLIAQMDNLLRHRNPYTGLTYAEDPAVMVIEEFNENSIFFFGTHKVLQTSPTLRRRMAERFTDWLAKRYGDEAGLDKAWGPRWKNALAGEGFGGESFAERSIVPGGNPWFFDPDQLDGAMSPIRARLLDTMLFLYEVQCDFYKRYADAMRAAGYTGEFLTSNWQAGRAFSHYYNLHSDALGGIIDRHNYFGGDNPDATMLTRAGSAILSSGACQVEGRPFMLSEWIHVFPNEYAAEGPAIIGAYGMGLQGWDVSYMFQNDDKGSFAAALGDQFCVTAPQIMGLFPAVARQVRRGDVREAAVAAERRVHLPSLAAGKLGFDDKYQSSGDVKESDSSTIPARSLAVARQAVKFTDTFVETPPFDMTPFQKDGALVASTGQLRWYEGAQPGVVIDTPGTQAIVGWLRGRKFQLGDVDVTSATPFAAVYVTAAGPDETIRTAKRLIVTTVARARNTDMKLSGGRLLAKGRAPILMEPVRVELKLKRAGTPTVYVCDHDGRRTAGIVQPSNGVFTLDSAQTKTIWYEVVYR